MAWTLDDMRDVFRDLTGFKTTSQLAVATITNYLNDYYRYDFAELVGLKTFKSDWTQEAVVTDSGEYTIGEEVINVEEPIFVNDEKITVYYNKDWFFSDFPEQEDYLTSPTLAIGSTAQNVANAAFKYKIGGWIYSKAAVAAGTALSGDTVPQSKYGAWLLEIDSDGTITVSEADDNATGYDTAALAVNDLPAETEDQAVMGYVTVINTSATFVPGTTALNASGVTATYTNGRASLRNAPQAILLDLSADKAYIRPKVHDTYLIKSKLTLQRPTALSDDDDEPVNTKWGLAICLGAAIKWLMRNSGGIEKVNELRNGNNPDSPPPGTLDYELANIGLKELRQMTKRRVERTF